MFSRILNSEFLFFSVQITVILSNHNLFWLMKINLGQIKANDKFHGRSLGFVDSRFVKTCDELIIGHVEVLWGALGRVQIRKMPGLVCLWKEKIIRQHQKMSWNLHLRYYIFLVNLPVFLCSEQEIGGHTLRITVISALLTNGFSLEGFKNSLEIRIYEFF